LSIFHPHARPPSLNASQKRTPRTSEPPPPPPPPRARWFARARSARRRRRLGRQTRGERKKKALSCVFGGPFFGSSSSSSQNVVVQRGVLFSKDFPFTFFSFPIFVWQKYYSVTPIICNSSPQVGVRPKYRKKTECTLLSLLHIFKLPHLALLFSFSQNNNNKKEEA